MLHVAKFYPPVAGGMERVVETLCRASEGLAESRVLALNTSPKTVEEIVDGVPVTRVGVAARVGSVPIAPTLSAHLRRVSADLIVFHEPHPWALLSYALSRPRARLAVWYHSDVVRHPLKYALFYAPVARPLYSRAERFIVSSPPLGANAAALKPYQDRITVIPFGIDVAEWATGSEAPEPFVLFAGRHVPYKGVDVLLRALQGTNIRAVIAGDGQNRTSWERLASTLGVQARFTGDLSDAELRAKFASCAVFVLPSITRAEAFGYVQLEAMASGKPVISTDLPSGVPWVNQDGRTGFVVPPGDPAALRAALVRLMADATLRRDLGAQGRARVEREFSLPRLRERLRDFYAEMA